ncbi:MAG: YMGG-like glycine zipper-containing protein [Pirellula sp.]|nr:YMGG-like glycine zipper-containing protein [Pirellula sp.]
MRWIRASWFAGSFLCCASTALGQYAPYPQNVNTRNGAILGGVTGAVIGGVIGHQRDDTTEGALIGGAVGAVAGGVLGNNRDHAERRQAASQYYYQRPTHYHSPTYVEHRTYVPANTHVITRRPVTVSEVVSMTQSGVSDTVIVSHIQANGVAARPDVNEVIWMSERGVSDYVITALQQNGNVPRPPRATVYRSQPSEVIIQEEYRPATRTIITTPSAPTYRSTRAPVYVERRGF